MLWNVVVPLIAGVVLGYFSRDRKRIDFGKVTFGAILVLIFCMGFSIGSNGDLLASMPRIGVNALVVLLLAMFFSAVFVRVTAKMVNLE